MESFLIFLGETQSHFAQTQNELIREHLTNIAYGKD
jgi:hypothetical protein